jgi:formylmethanofuran dehydrogenase subunit E
MNTKSLKGVTLDELIARGIEFHGHSGPFLVIGIKMGMAALKELNSTGYFDIHVMVETGTTPPLSCLIDGIQISTGCTLGKGNITVKANRKARAVFTRDEKSLEMEVKPEILELILGSSAAEESAGRFAKTSVDDLFTAKVNVRGR